MTPLEMAKAERDKRLQGGESPLAMAKAERARRTGPTNTNPGVSPDAPADMVFNPENGSYTSRELMRNASKPGQVAAFAAGAGQGVTLGFGDEITGAYAAASPGKGTPEERRTFSTERARAETEAAQRDFPKTSLAGEIGGGVALPAGAARTVTGAAVLGAGTGAVYAAGQSEGTVPDRAGDATQGAFTGLLFGGALAAAQKGVSAGYQRMFNKTVKRPTVETLREAKTAAYAAVDRSGEAFEPSDMQALFQRAQAMADDANFIPDVDRQTFAALKILENNQGKKLTLGQLDKMRQGLWKRFGSADNEVAILDMIGAIDDLVESRAGSSELMGAARAANARYSKSKLLEDAFNKARLQTESTGSGGNILNKYRQAVTSIVTNPKKAKWFDAQELALMERFVEGDLSENVARRIGKLAPGGNGLMQALSLVAASVDPTFIAASGAAQAAKSFADRSAMRGADAVQDVVATGSVNRGARRNYGRAGQTGGVLSGQTGD